MKTSAIFALAAVAKLAAAHTTVYNILVNDVDQGLSNFGSTGYIRNPPNNDPVVKVESADMTCNINSGKAAKTVSVKGGDKVTFEWHHDNNTPGDDIIAESHHGPVMTYIAPGASDGKGAVWIKLAEEGYSNGKWAIDNLRTNRGKHSITVPDLAAGDYLLRPELIALHEGMDLGKAQFYMECIQVRITSSGAKTLPAGVAIPGAYKAEDAGVHFNIYNGFTSYPIPGPKVWDGASGGAAPAPAPATTLAPAPTTLRTLVLSSTAAAVPTTSAVVVVPTTSAVVVVPTTTAAVVVPTTSAAVVVPTTSAVVVVPTTSAVVVPTTSTVASVPAPSPTNACPGGETGPVAKKWAQCGGQNFKGASACESGSTCKVMNPYYSQCI